jgi:predicted SprT family Zn-dependent metalloprotease
MTSFHSSTSRHHSKKSHFAPKSADSRLVGSAPGERQRSTPEAHRIETDTPRLSEAGPGSASSTGLPPRVPEFGFTEAALEISARRLLMALGCEPLARRVRVRWNPRLRTTAGLACASESLITLNPRLIPFGMPEVDRTLRHELAHLLARFRAGRRRIEPHGPEWRRACCDLGLPGEKRCHELPLPRRRIKPKHLYRCRHCQAEVWRVRPFCRAVACLKCCRTFNRSRYHEKYRFVKVAAAL